MPKGADASWNHPAPRLKRKAEKRSWFSSLTWHQKQIYGIAVAVHHAGSHTEKKLGGARDSSIRITVQL